MEGVFIELSLRVQLMFGIGSCMGTTWVCFGPLCLAMNWYNRTSATKKFAFYNEWKVTP